MKNPAESVERSIDAFLENISEKNEQYKSSITQVTFDIVLRDPDVPDQVKRTIGCLQEMYTIVDKIGEKAPLN